MAGAENRRLQQWLESLAGDAPEPPNGLSSDRLPPDSLQTALQQVAQDQGQPLSETPHAQMPVHRLDPTAASDLLMAPSQRGGGAATQAQTPARQPNREHPLTHRLTRQEAPLPSIHSEGAEPTRRVVQVGMPVNRSNVVILPKRERVGQVDYGSFLSASHSAPAQDEETQTLQQQPDPPYNAPEDSQERSPAAQAWLLQQSTAEPSPVEPQMAPQDTHTWQPAVEVPALQQQQDGMQPQEREAPLETLGHMAEAIVDDALEPVTSDTQQEAFIAPPEDRQPEQSVTQEEREKDIISMVQIEALLNQALSERLQQQRDEAPAPQELPVDQSAQGSQEMQEGLEAQVVPEPTEALEDLSAIPLDETPAMSVAQVPLPSADEMAELTAMELDSSPSLEVEEATESSPRETRDHAALELDGPLSTLTWIEDEPAQPEAERVEKLPAVDEPAQELVAEPAQELVTEPAQELVAEPAQELVTEPAQELVTEPAQELVTEPAQEPVTEPAQEPVVELAQEAISPSEHAPLTEAQQVDASTLEAPQLTAQVQSDANESGVATKMDEAGEETQQSSASASESPQELDEAPLVTNRVAKEILQQIEQDLPVASQESTAADPEPLPASSQTTTIPAAELADVELDEKSGEVVDELPVPKVSRIQQRRRFAKASKEEPLAPEVVPPKPTSNPGFLFGRLKDRRVKLAAAALEDPADVEQQMRQPKPLVSTLKRRIGLPKSMWLPFGWYAMGVVVNNISDGAIRWYQGITRMDADVQSAFLLDRARHLQRLERMEEAKEVLEMATALDGVSSSAYLLLAEVLQSLDMQTQAEQVLFKALNNGYDDAYLYLRLGTLMLDGERAEAAIAYLRQAVTMAPDLYDALCALAKALWQSNGHEESLAHLERAREIRPFDPRAFMLTGEVLESLKRDEDAALFYQQADALNNMLQVKPAHERVEPDELS
ncbi:tetratricopeptide repeat protein [Magnetococcus sp. PR-3]|uniref:tetratricopeptide repeat protein n=1 Tax=Magnetococcus sp. PR-3 TaxID=3120355 RepID=UPI002FCE40A7